jgi:hypothetical protein
MNLFCLKPTQNQNPCIEGYCKVEKYSEIEGKWIMFKYKGTISFMRPTPFDSTLYFTNLEYNDIFSVQNDTAKCFHWFNNNCYLLLTELYIKNVNVPDSGTAYSRNNDTLKIIVYGATPDGWENVSYYYKPYASLLPTNICTN